MSRRLLSLLTVLLLVSPLLVGAAADDLYREQMTAGGADTLSQQLPADVQALLEELGLDVASPDSFTTLSGEKVLSVLGELLRQQGKTISVESEQALAFLIDHGL